MVDQLTQGQAHSVTTVALAIISSLYPYKPTRYTLFVLKVLIVKMRKQGRGGYVPKVIKPCLLKAA